MHRTLKIIRTAYLEDQLTAPDCPHVALAGRSNVGKSTLLNCLAGRKALAKTSSKPGKTRSINFYEVEPDGFHIVDLPGYGYAKRSKKERALWGKLIEQYLTDKNAPSAVVMLVDARIPPQQIDLDLAAYVNSLNIPLIPVLTKVDKCKQRERAARAKQWQELLRSKRPPLMVSGKTGMNRDKLWDILAKAVGTDQES